MHGEKAIPLPLGAMPKLPKFEITEVPDGYKIEVPATLSESGKRERYIRADEKEAKRLQRSFKKHYHEYGTKAGIVSPRLASEAAEAAAMLKEFGATILDAAREYTARRKAEGACVTMRTAWEGYRARLAKLGRSEASLEDYRRTQKSLPSWFLAMEVAAIEGGDVERALDASIKTKPVKRGPTWNRRLREVRAVLNWSKNTDAKPAPIRQRDPEIIDADTAKRLMAAAEKEGCALPFALMLFAGIRPQGELNRITWSAIKKDHIRLTREETKTATDRQIPIMPNLRKWLDAHKGESILPLDWDKKRRAARKAAHIEGQDVLRHTFGSAFYRLHGEHETVEAMGHTTLHT
ncbi:MAG: hypothetical protein VCA38_03715 [Roseibacillus sp.]